MAQKVVNTLTDRQKILACYYMYETVCFLCAVLIEGVGGVHEVVAREWLDGEEVGLMLLLVENSPPKIVEAKKSTT